MRRHLTMGGSAPESPGATTGRPIPRCGVRRPSPRGRPGGGRVAWPRSSRPTPMRTSRSPGSEPWVAAVVRGAGGYWPGPPGLPPAMTSLRVVLPVTLGVLPIPPAGAQGTQPLRKAELVRMLARRALSKPQIATLVRRNCVTFQPTAHDRAELRAAGADDAVLAAIDQCLRARLARATPPPSPRPVAPAPARPSAPVPSPLVAVTDTSA